MARTKFTGGYDAAAAAAPLSGPSDEGPARASIEDSPAGADHSLTESTAPYQVLTRPATQLDSPGAASRKPSGKRKRSSALLDNAPISKNDFDHRLNVQYHVKSLSDVDGTSWDWTEMRHYGKVQIGHSDGAEQTEESEDIEPMCVATGDLVYIQPSDSRKPRQADNDAHPFDDCWVAQILETRSIEDERGESEHVYLRVNWLYRPEELPQRRQDYHADGEVIPSNHMEIIEAATVVGKVSDLKPLHEDSFEALSGGYTELFWRQTFDGHARKLSKLRAICSCQQPANPDFGPLTCNGIDPCGFLMHPACVENYVLDELHRQYVLEEDPADEARSTKSPTNKKPRLSNGTPVNRKSNSATTNAKSGRKFFEVDLVEQPPGVKPDDPFVAKITRSQPIKTARGAKLAKTFEYPIHCLRCRHALKQQVGHALLDPQLRVDDTE